ncbi:hypothetical protein [Mesonia sp. K4-1]|uniref:hypothetical protein n=1 Tax=Mesonia sp. K4-1 TaxID=2602760 RepID=UPI0011CA3D2F|nr:hypothetical protein [Mesonia sp. K4-1]TXK75764.1 hypothetical protein FT986_09670 [Mesonia sp. K4-1]
MKTFLKIISAVGVLLIVGYIATHFFVKNKIETALDKPIAEGVVKYEDLGLNLFRGSVDLANIKWKSDKNESHLSVPRLKVTSFSYYALLFDDQIKVKRVFLKEPKIFLHQQTDSVKSDSENDGKKFEKEILVEKFELDNGNFILKKDSIEKMRVAELNFKMLDIFSNKKSRNNNVPFDYRKYEMSGGGFFFDMNDLQELNVEKVSVSEKNISLRNLHMAPKHSKEKYIEHIPYEKDWMDLKIDELSILDYTLNLKDKKSFSAPLVEINKLNFDIYRDKTVKDDVREKDLYSKMLRDLDFGVKIDSLSVTSSYVSYEEQLHKPGPAARIFFEDFNSGISNITNLDLSREDFPVTKVNISTQFMGNSKLDFNWSFKVNDTLDRFTIQGSGYQIPDTSINSFFRPAFNMEAEGGVDEVYYNFSGDRNQASGDIKLDYEKFKLHVLKKDRERKNKVLSFLANIVVKNSSKNGGISKNVGEVKRDKTKSFWNYFWSCLEAGLKKVFI